MRVCMCVCTAVKQKRNRPYNKQYNKSPDSTVYWDMPRVRVPDAAEIKQVSWIILKVKSHSDSVPAGAPGLGVRVESKFQWPAWAQLLLMVLSVWWPCIVYLLIPTAMLSASTSSTLGKYDTARSEVEVKSKHSRDQDLEHLDFHSEWPLQVGCCCCCLWGWGWDCCSLVPTCRQP